jgi:hypothetical protein
MDLSHRTKTRIPLGLLLAGVLCFGTARGGELWTQSPHLTLEKGDFQIAVLLPGEDAYYQGVRFDHSGIVAQARLGEVEFLGMFQPEAPATMHDRVGGLVDEFEMHDPPGFAAAASGQGFLKIGVGLLRKEDKDAYEFWRNYEVMVPAVTTWKQRPQAVEFTQKLAEVDGWGYELTKRIELGEKEGALMLSRTLKNTGQRTITVETYNHHFLSFSQRPISPGFVVQTPFSISPEIGVRNPHLVELEQDRIAVVQPWGEEFLHLRVDFDQPLPLDQPITVQDSVSGQSVEIWNDTPLSAFALFGTGRVISPEPFIALHLLPGQEITWVTQYQFLHQLARQAKP